ncbi:MAG: response regulator [Pseudomonadota bacterium]|nr:response regulator [Pseudomonadota bacterium]
MSVDMNMNILIVDDYKSMLGIIDNLLKQLGFKHVHQALDGETALRMLRELPFGLVISDWHMGAMSGLDLLKEVRTDARLAKLPFIMATAESKPESVAAAKAAGVNNYLIKPFNAETLRQKLKAVLGAFGSETHG